jgi:GNAT superfamily N-acetyltransferase
MECTFATASLADPAENRIIVELLNRFMTAVDGPNQPGISPDIIGQLRELGTARVFLCRRQGRTIGIAVCFVGFSTYRQRRLLNIHDFYVCEEAQGQGVGKAFLAHIEAVAQAEGYCRLTLEVYQENTKALRLYNRCGFHGSGPAAESPVVHFMKKELA